MTSGRITLAAVADQELLARLLDPRRTKAWSHGKLRNPAADGSDTYSFFTGPAAILNVPKVADAILRKRPWSPLLEDRIPKPLPLREARAALTQKRRTAARECRPVHHDTRVDHARQLALALVLRPLIEAKLTHVAAAYVTGRRLDDVLTKAITTIRGRKLVCAKTLDVKACFDHIAWRILDQAIDRHLTEEVDKDVRAMLKASYRAPALRRDGTPVERTEGIPQGSVLAPLLVNLYFADFDNIVQREIANSGCSIWRYSDDILLAAPNLEALRQATVVVERELRRLRLRIKPETDRTRDLRNPENAPRWLGFAFTTQRTWVPRERIERKAAALLEDLARGLLEGVDLEERLDALRVHYEQVVHIDDAEKAVEAIRRMVSPYLPYGRKRKNGVEQVRRQIERRSPFPRSKPAREGDRRDETTFGVIAPFSYKAEEPTRQEREEEPRKGRAEDHGEVRGEACADPRVGGTPHGGSIARYRGREENRANSSLPNQADTSPLEAPSAPALPDRAAHPEGTNDNDRLDAAVVTVRASRYEWGEASVRALDGTTWTSRYRIPGAHSAEEVALGGYRLALPRAIAMGVRQLTLVVRQRTLQGHLARGHRVRSVFVMRSWARLLQDLDALAGVEAGFSVRDGIPGSAAGRSGASSRTP